MTFETAGSEALALSIAEPTFTAGCSATDTQAECCRSE
jgi:hypothetical protein